MKRAVLNLMVAPGVKHLSVHQLNSETEEFKITMKTAVKHLAAVIFLNFLLMVGFVDAKGTEKKALIQEIKETSIQLEAWMTDETIWDASSSLNEEFSQEIEPELQIETWMTNETIWNANSNFFAEFFQETEIELEIESWMTSSDTWSFNYQAVTAAETKLELEDRITTEDMLKVQETAIKEKLTLESRVLDTQTWR